MLTKKTAYKLLSTQTPTAPRPLLILSHRSVPQDNDTYLHPATISRLPYSPIFASSSAVYRARTSVDIAQVGGLLSPSWPPVSSVQAPNAPRQIVDLVSASPRQTSSTPSPVLLSPNLRKILGPNPNLSDNKLLRSWEYAAWMMSYCIACTLVGVLAVTLLPDPNTLEQIRGGGEEDSLMMGDAQNMMMVAQIVGDNVGYENDYGAVKAPQEMVGNFGAVDDTGDYKQGFEALESAQKLVGAFGAVDDINGYYRRFGNQNNTGGQAANIYGTQDSKNNAVHDTKGSYRYRIQGTGALAADGSGKEKLSKGYNRYKETSREPPQNYFDNWAEFNKKEKNYLKPSPEKQSPEHMPPSTHYQVIRGHGGSFGGSRQPLVSKASSYTSYSSQPS